MGCVDMFHDALGGSCVRLCCVFCNMGQRGSRPLKLRRVLCGLLFGRFPKLRVLYAFAHKLGGFFGFVYFHKPVAGHFLRDFIAGL